jgi:hypothetical protein
MEYINSVMEYFKTLFSQYVYNLNRSNTDIEASINTIESVKIIDEKIGNISDIINLLNEMAPKIMINIKKKHKFSNKILLNPSEINYVIKWIDRYQKSKPEPLLQNLTVDDVILNTNITFLYNKMILIQQRYEIIDQYIRQDET